MTVFLDRVRALLCYDPCAGKFAWKPCCSQSPQWLAQYSGLQAGFVDRHGYRIIKIDGRSYKAHRLAFLLVTGNWPSTCLDHINGDGSDNRWANLRPANASLNIANSKRRVDNVTGFKGVSRFRTGWRAQIRKSGITYTFPKRSSPVDAHADYVAAASRLFGEYARVA